MAGCYLPARLMPPAIITVFLLTLSNIFMTFAWYGHLKNLKSQPWIYAALISWGIALFEYCFQVPANRLGAKAGLATAQLKTLQEVITLVVFVAFATLYMGEHLRWNHLVGFGFVALGALFVFKPW